MPNIVEMILDLALDSIQDLNITARGSFSFKIVPELFINIWLPKISRI